MNTNALRSLWQEAFGDPDSFVEAFFRTGFSPERHQAIWEGERPVAALYWLDCHRGTQRFAYIYAVAVAKSHRGQGLSRMLMEQTHEKLKSQGYQGAVLCPASGKLFSLYEKFGYRTFSYVDTFCQKPGDPISLEELGPESYAQARKAFLPEGGLEQDGIPFLGTWCRFYRGKDFLLACALDEGELFVQEFLGNRDAAPGITAALGAKKGHFRTPGTQTPFAMYLPFTQAPAPKYLGIVFD